MTYILPLVILAIIIAIIWDVRRNTQRKKERNKPKPEYKIYQNGYGKFEVHFLFDAEENWYRRCDNMFLTLRLNDCHTLNEVHEAIKQYKEHIMKSEFKKVWP